MLTLVNGYNKIECNVLKSGSEKEKQMELTIIFPVLNEKKRLESGVIRTVEYLQKIDFSD